MSVGMDEVENLERGKWMKYMKWTCAQTTIIIKQQHLNSNSSLFQTVTKLKRWTHEINSHNNIIMISGEFQK